jgi:hypothetical protein
MITTEYRAGVKAMAPISNIPQLYDRFIYAPKAALAGSERAERGLIGRRAVPSDGARRLV